MGYALAAYAVVVGSVLVYLLRLRRLRSGLREQLADGAEQNPG